jgi:hypothetical protein
MILHVAVHAAAEYSEWFKDWTENKWRPEWPEWPETTWDMAACQRFLETLLSFPGFVENNLKHSVSEHLNISELSGKMRARRQFESSANGNTVLLYLLCPPGSLLALCPSMSSCPRPNAMASDVGILQFSSVDLTWLACRGSARFVAGGLQSFQEKSACLLLSHFRHFQTLGYHEIPYGIK